MDSINDCYNRCHSSFDSLVAALKSPLRDYGDQIPTNGVVNEYGRFNVWSGSIGAKHPPKKRSSLDYRLRDSEFYKIRVVDILLRLDRTLRKATQLLRNEQQPFEEIACDVDQPSDPDSDDTSTTRSTDSSLPDESQQTTQETRREMPELYESIQNSVRHLYSMSMVIRRPIPIDRLSRASKIPIQHFQLFDQRHVEECFPGATEVLQKRLANAITVRRQLVEYNEQHYQKLSQIPNPEPAISQIPISESYTPQPEDQQQQQPTEPLIEAIVNPAPSILERSIIASTEATKIAPPEDLASADVQSESGTVSSFGFSEGGGERIRIPPRPQDPDGEPLEQFLCPFCYHLVEIGTTKAWIKHIFRDLQAYVCTFDDCKDPDRMFETRNDWIRHEFQHHRREWHCNTLDHPVCCSQREFIDHMRESHTLRVSEDQLQSLGRLCERPATSAVVACPLCTENQHGTQNGFDRFRSLSITRNPDEIALNEISHDDIAEYLRLPDGKFDEGLQTKDLARVTKWAMKLPEDYEHLPSSEMVDYRTPSSPQPVTPQVSHYIFSSTKLKRHLAQHLERLALFSINPSKMIPDDQASISTGDAIPGSESSLALSSSLDSHITAEGPEHQETSEFDPPPSDDVLASYLLDKIWQNMEHNDDHSLRFFPDSRWDGLWEANEVEATLRKCRTDPTPDLVHFIMKKAPKIFAILVNMRQPELISRFQLEDFGQEKLPVEPSSIHKMLGDDNDRILDFCDKQWWFTSPIFTRDKFRYEFDDRHHLPFTTAGKQATLGASDYGTVEERSIHVDHIELPADPNLAKDELGNPRVAVKTLFSSDLGLADERAGVLEMIRGQKTDHLIKAIAYYRYRNKHHFMFPWAEHGNLREFWTKGKGPSLEKHYLIWVFGQLTGLADAIDQLHYQIFYRHRDLKPENILCFSQHTNDGSLNPGVRMVITDVGVAKRHTEWIPRRQNTNTRVSTERYSAPDIKVTPNAPLSRRFDIWSMGCILLEFVIWILYGREELIRITEAPISTFYKLKRDEMGMVIAVEIEPTVQGWISSIRKDWRCASGTALERLVSLITDQLLVVNLQDPIIESHVSTEPSEQMKRRTSASGMRKGLKDILKDLQTGEINAVGERPSNDTPNPQGPSHFASMMQDGLIEPNPVGVRPTENWIYTPDDTFDVHFLDDFDQATATPKVDKPLLCPRCRSLPLWSIECNFMDSRSGLDTKARDDNCELCKLLAYCIRDRKYSMKDPIHFSRAGSYLTVDDGRGQPVLNLCSVPGSGVEPLRDVQIGFSKLPEAGSEVHFSVLKKWIRDCDSAHHCVPKQRDFIPLRLLHITHLDSGAVRLVERGGGLNQPVKYVALSHCWGHKQFWTTPDNIQALKNSFEASRLPKTFRDAISVTQGLGLEYLWIDSVCIIQDNAQDWSIESKLMEQIFSSAYCTIAASCASGANDGFLKVRPERRFVPMSFGGYTYYACENIDDFSTDVDQSELNQRAWVMQDRAFSRRTIYFAENQSYWECGGGVRCETMTKMKSRQPSFLSDANFPHSAEKYTKELKIDFFQTVYTYYSKLALTYLSDRPVAIRGLEQRLLSTFNTTGGYGVLDCYFHQSLLWKRGGVTLRRLPRTQGEPVPSWSWMAYDGAVDYVSTPSGKVTWFSNIKSPFSEAPSESSHDGHGALVLEAPVRRIINDPPKESMFLDEPALHLIQPMECVVLGSGSGSQRSAGDYQRHWVILVNRISNVDDSNNGVYERVGVAVLERRHIDFQGPAREVRVQ